MLGSKKLLNDSNVIVLINQNLIEKSERVKHLCAYFNNIQSCKTHIDKLCKKVSKLSEMIHKLRYYVQLSTLKIVYFSLFLTYSIFFVKLWKMSFQKYFLQIKNLSN